MEDAKENIEQLGFAYSEFTERDIEEAVEKGGEVADVLELLSEYYMEVFISYRNTAPANIPPEIMFARTRTPIEKVAVQKMLLRIRGN